MRQISMQISGELERQMAALAAHWGLPRQRHNTAVVERAVALSFMLELGYDEYRRRRELIESDG